MFTKQELGNIATFLQRVNVTGNEAPTLVALQQKINKIFQKDIETTIPSVVGDAKPKGKNK